MGHELAQGLVGAWLLNEVNSRTLFDSSPGNLGGIGSLLLSPVWDSNQLGPFIRFDGSTQSISGSGLNLSGSPFTISVLSRLYSLSVPIGNGCLFSVGNAAANDQLIHLVGGSASSNTGVQFGMWFDDLTISSTYSWADLLPVRITISLDSAKLQSGYINGAFSASRTATAMFTGTGVWHMAQRISDQFAPVEIIDVFVWSRALSVTEVAQHHAEPYAMFQTRPLQRWLTIPANASPQTPYNPWMGRAPLLAM